MYWFVYPVTAESLADALVCFEDIDVPYSYALDMKRVGEMALDEIKELIPDKDETTLARWLVEEKVGENRKAIVRLLNKALSVMKNAEPVNA